MLLASFAAVVAVALGTALALLSPAGPGRLGAVRGLALVASLGVVGWHLIPEAFEALGALAPVGIAAGALGPGLLERALRGQDPPGAEKRSHAASLTITYVALLLHRAGDGAAMGAAAEAASGTAALLAVLAIAAHIVPVTALMILAVLAVHTRGVAALHGLGLAVSTLLGVLAAGAALHAAPGLAHGGWVEALVAGLLLHVIGHDLPGIRGGRDAPAGGW